MILLKQLYSRKVYCGLVGFHWFHYENMCRRCVRYLKAEAQMKATEGKRTWGFVVDCSVNLNLSYMLDNTVYNTIIHYVYILIYEYIDSSFARNHLSHQLYSLLERTMLHLNAGFGAPVFVR